MKLSDALSKLPPNAHAVDWLIAAIREGLTVGEAFIFAWGQHTALKQQQPAFIRGNRQ